MKKLYIILCVFLMSACSAEWHLQRAIKKNPTYGDSTKIKEIVIYHDTIRDTIYVPEHNFDFTIDSLSSILDSFSLVYNDSFITIYSKLDSLGRLKLKGTVKEKLVPYEKIIHDTLFIESKCPESINITEGYPKIYFWILIAGFLLILIFLIKR